MLASRCCYTRPHAAPAVAEDEKEGECELGRRSILHFRSKAFHVAFRLSICLRFVIVARRLEAFSTEKVNDDACDAAFQEGSGRRQMSAWFGAAERWPTPAPLCRSTVTIANGSFHQSPMTHIDGTTVKRVDLITLQIEARLVQTFC